MILLTGGNGQLGTELRHLLDEKGLKYVSTDAQEMDITDEQATLAFIQELKPTVIYHCAAYTAVDKAEDEGKELDEKINVNGTENVAKAAKAVGANFGKYGHNFVYTMKRLAQTHPRLTVVDDQYGRPTWTRTLAEFMVYIIENNADYGIYHLSNDNSCSWYEFAKEILKETDVEVAPVTSAEYPQKAKRPQYSVLDLTKAKNTGFVIPTWEEALADMTASLEKEEN